MAGPASAADPCGHARALYKTGYYADAEQAYKALLGVKPCARAKLLEEARAAAARQAVTPKEQLAQALRLQNAGFEDEARKLVKAVAQDSTEPIPAKLRAIDQRVGWWRSALGRYGPPVLSLLELLAAFVGVLVAALLAFTGVNALRLRFKRSAQLAGFTGSSDDTLAPILGAALSERLARMRDEQPAPNVAWQSGTEPKFEIPTAVAEVVPQANLLAGLLQMLDRLLFRRLSIVSGTVHPVHHHRGAGLTLVLATRNGRMIEQVTIWESEFMLKEAGSTASDLVRYERLILPAAVWLAYRKKWGFKEDKPPLLARSWRSYALFALGEIVPDRAKERRLYEQALDRDPCNLGARLNLAALLLWRPEYEVPPRREQTAVGNKSLEGWEERKRAAAVHLGVVTTLACPKEEPIWYRASYMQAILYIYCGKGTDASRILCGLRRAMSINCESPRLRALLAALQQPVAVLEQTSKLLTRDARVDAPAEPRGGWRSADAEYNLACFWSRYARAYKAIDEKAKLGTAEAVRLLRRASARNEGAIEEARVDPAFDEIRSSPGFKALVKKTETPPEPEKPERYAITLDLGPGLLTLALADEIAPLR